MSAPTHPCCGSGCLDWELETLGCWLARANLACVGLSTLLVCSVSWSESAKARAGLNEYGLAAVYTVMVAAIVRKTVDSKTGWRARPSAWRGAGGWQLQKRRPTGGTNGPNGGQHGGRACFAGQFRPAASCRNRAAAGKWRNRRLSRTLQDPLLHVYRNLKSGVHFNEALALTLLPQGVL